MYVITDHNNGNFVILGPIDWRPRYISDIIFDELQEEVTVTAEDEQRVPYEILPGVKVRRCNITYENLTNEKIHRHEGPFWIYDDENPEVQAIASWIRVDKPISQVKGELKSLAASVRWQKESLGVVLNIQETDVFCDTSRGNRNIFLQKYSMMQDNETIKWKFPDNIWLTLSKTELGFIVSKGAEYIQSCFDWEADKSAEIDACTTLEELDAIIIQDKNEEENA